MLAIDGKATEHNLHRTGQPCDTSTWLRKGGRCTAGRGAVLGGSMQSRANVNGTDAEIRDG